MTVKELRKLLKSELHDRNICVKQPWELLKFKYLNHIEVSNVDMLFTIKEVGSTWEVKIEERGTIQERQVFSNESEACDYFRNKLIKG